MHAPGWVDSRRASWKVSVKLSVTVHQLYGLLYMLEKIVHPEYMGTSWTKVPPPEEVSSYSQ